LSVFDQALAITLGFEGGTVDDPRDPGGRTAYGITQNTFDAYLRSKGVPPRDVFTITGEEIEEIYYTGYWQAIRADEMPPALAVVAFDIAVNSGPARALQWLAEGADDPVRLTARRMQHYTDLKDLWPIYSRGWSRRAIGVLSAANDIARATV
jgi:lysozyme family protein